MTRTSRRRELIHRHLDFWLLGGLSLVVWALFHILAGVRGRFDFINSYFVHLAATMAMLAYVVNYPHFLASYRLAYGRGWASVRRHWFQLIFVPIALFALLLGAYALYAIPIRQVAAWEGFLGSLREAGVHTGFLENPLLGSLILGSLVNLMYLTVGWHYAKQTYGCMMVYAAYDGYRIEKIQTRILRLTLGLSWWLTFVHANLSGSTTNYRGVSYTMLKLPHWLYVGSFAAFVGSLGLTLLLVFGRNWRLNRQRPSLNMLVPFLAMIAWWVPFVRQNDFYIWMVPLFHSLQYLAFVYRVEEDEIVRAEKKAFKTTAVIFGLIVAGWLAFDFLPNMVDYGLDSKLEKGVPFFVIGTVLFINIHHYFIDNAIWRLRDPELRRRLVGEDNVPASVASSPSSQASGF